MELNKEYKQIFLHNDTPYDVLKGKVVENVGFTNIGSYDLHMFIITFTDKTYVAIGTDYKDLDNGDDEPKLENQYIFHPQSWNRGNFELFRYVDTSGNKKRVRYQRFIELLRDFGIWQFTDAEENDIIENDKKKKDEYEYQQYLRLKEKFEPNDK